MLVCVASRVVTTITYIEDPDSLRFAMSVAHGFDLASMQPHFPGYPVFWAVAASLYALLGSFSTAFSVVGGLATAGLIAAILFLWKKPLASPEGMAVTAVVFFNPLIWLLGNRYMPDLLGTALAITAFALLIRALAARAGTRSGDEGSAGRGVDVTFAVAGIAATGGLAGLRLSYLPLLLVPVVLVLARILAAQRWVLLARVVAVGLGSIAVWLVPMIADTGWQTLIDVATRQTSGHFTEFGGTVQTEADLGRRAVRFVRGVWADGLGAWWPGRHLLTVAVGGGVLLLAAAGTRRLQMQIATPRARRVALWVLASAGIYAVWIFFFQNVIHKSRHVLPLLPFVLLVLSAGGTWLWQRGGAWARATVLAAGLAYAAVTLVLVQQHRSPTAIAQATAFVQEQAARGETVRVISDPLVNTYMSAQEVDARFVSVADSGAVRQALRAGAGRTIVVGTYPGRVDTPPDTVRRFFHNPFVNRMWADVTVRVYEPDSSDEESPVSRFHDPARDIER